MPSSMTNLTPVPAAPIVAVVDDDQQVLTAMRRALRSLPVDVRLFPDAHTALAALATQRVAVLVSDFNMPGMTGVELVAEVLRRSPATVRVLMTGRHALDAAVDGVNRGEIFRFVEKPFVVADLRIMMTEAVARHHELVAAAAHRDHSTRRELAHRVLEAEHPGIHAVHRDRDGSYVVPEVCDLEALGLFGVSLTRSS
jgi:DNA-binding NtrC family response regulator